MSDELWEKVNQRCGEDVLDIVMGLVNQNIRAGVAADKIVRRCNIAVKVFTEDLQEKFETIKILIGNVDHTKGNGENSAKMRGQMLDDIRELIQAISRGE